MQNALSISEDKEVKDASPLMAPAMHVFYFKNLMNGSAVAQW